MYEVNVFIDIKEAPCLCSLNTHYFSNIYIEVLGFRHINPLSEEQTAYSINNYSITFIDAPTFSPYMDTFMESYSLEMKIVCINLTYIRKITDYMVLVYLCLTHLNDYFMKIVSIK